MSTLAALPLYLMPPFPVRRFSVDEYHRMIDAGILTENDPVELLEGWITPKMPRNPPHAATITQADKKISKSLPDGWHTRVQMAITTADSQPEPDLVVALGEPSAYFSRHPEARDIALLVEVSNSALVHDRSVKGRIYAREAIPVYWIINLVDRVVEVYTDPTGPTASPGYRQRQDYTVNDTIPLPLGGQVLGAELLL